jgi:GH25 family lysozyme M1 (1,4-beta-N-acetylmuramidase)
MVASAQGKDFSSFQSPVGPSDLTGLSFAIARVSNWDGTVMGTDPHFEGNWRAFKTAGIHRGCYWYLSQHVSPGSQAAYFVNAVKAAGLGPGDMLIADAEVPYAGADAMTHAFCTEVEAIAGPHCPVLVYTDGVTGKLLVSCTSWPLWFAWPSPVAPAASFIAPWKEWRLWQYGTIGSVDADAANGTDADLDAWIADYLPVPVVAPPAIVTVTADGTKTLGWIAAANHTAPSGILRATAIADGLYPANVAAWLNAVFGGNASPTAPVPAGLVLRIP